jgi:hypothetical protein
MKAMRDSTDIAPDIAIYHEHRARLVIEGLKKRSMNGQYVPNRAEALKAAMAMIPPGLVVARGDSISVVQVGVIEEVLKRNQNKVIDPFALEWTDVEERARLERESFFADIMVVSVNAITLDGRLVSIDGNGNRVAATIYGPKKIICIVGVNKIVKDVPAAIERAHDYAAQVNALRFIRVRNPSLAELPCLKTGKCIDCTHERKICNYTMIIEGAMPQHKGRINVILVGEELGI